ncbi:MAG TPA: twin-arginine translocase TatA/TatE family subunit [Anaerolineaceae bacterium]|jgi:Sec-independent protein translocase protein TatA|nr:twin-arginine translocase TatA/TatE family subunit [Anaerolineaceae bacterium]HPS32067.1 twin-arginine translocase TatA/TatE family subunit [Anaerolineaceae bacterium]
MEFFNLGWSEIFLIVLVAFVILGPGKISQAARDFGAWLRKLDKSEAFRDVMHTTDQIRNFPRKIMDEAGLDPVFPDRSMYQEVRKTPGERFPDEKSPPADSGDLP